MNFDNIEPQGELTEEQKKAIELHQKMQKTVIISVTAGVLITLGLGILTVLLLMKFGVFTFNRDAFKKTETSQTQSKAADDGTIGVLADSGIENKLKALEKVMASYYYGDVDAASASDAVCKAYIDSYGDEYSVYYTSDEYTQLSESITGSSFYGIGIYCRSQDDDGLLVMGFTDDSAAKEAGLKEGDVIISVDGNDVRGLDSDSAITYLHGEDGSSVEVEVVREGEEETLKYTVERRQMDESYVKHGMLDDGKTGYIRIKEFNNKTAEQFRSGLQDLKKEDAKALVIDLRNNTGGVVKSALEIMDDILPEGNFGGMRFKDGTREEFKGTSPQKLDLPYVVLVNEYTASASEIFAAGVQDFGAARLVGTKTYGKGITQKVVKLDDGSAVKYTDAELYSPNGNVWHKKGLEPDVEAQLPEDATEDTQLEAALEVLY